MFSCVFTEERIVSGHTSIKHRLECCSDVCPSVGFFIYPRFSSRKDRITETTCFCETSMQYNVFLNSSPDVWFDANLSLSYAGS